MIKTISLIALSAVSCFSIPAFPGAEGFGAQTTGGRGGQVIFVTTLNESGPGSLLEASKVIGPKYILFKVSGIIKPSARWDNNYLIQEGDVTIAGQTSPGGITVRGLYSDNTHGNPHNIIIRHLRSRDGVDQDNLRLLYTKNVVVDHCSFAWAGDECAQIGYSDTVSYQNCIFSETLGEHYDRGGILIKYSDSTYTQTGISFHHNTFYRIGGRLPQIDLADSWDYTCDAGHVMEMDISYNLMFDPGTNIALKNTLLSPYGMEVDAVFKVNLINNYYYARSSYVFGMFSTVDDTIQRFYLSGNKINIYPLYKDEQLMYCCNHFYDDNPNTQHYGGVTNSRHDFPTLTYTGSGDTIRQYMLANVGAFPRDSMDRRIVQNMQSGIVDTSKPLSEALADDAFILDFDTLNPPAYPADSDSDGMPDSWEVANDLNPYVQDHTGKQLSVRYTGIEGYDNLECYLNRLSDSLVTGVSTVVSAIEAHQNIARNRAGSIIVEPNPCNPAAIIKYSHELNRDQIVAIAIYDIKGNCIEHIAVAGSQLNSGVVWSALGRPSGIYIVRLAIHGLTLARKVVLQK